MPDNRIVIGVDLLGETEAESKLMSLATTLRQLNSETNRAAVAAQRGWAGTVGLDRQIAGIREEIQATRELIEQQEQLNRMIQANADAQARASRTGMSELSGKSAEDSARSFKTLSASVAEAEGRFGSLRHVIAIFDEANRGQRGAMVASITAFVRDAHLFELAIENLASPWTAVAAAGVAALGAIIVAAERAHEMLVATRDAAASMALAGDTKPAGVTYEAQAGTQIQADRASTNEYLSTQIKIQEELNRLTGSARAFSAQVQTMGKDLAGLNWGDSAKEVEEITKKMNEGTKAFAKWAEIKFNFPTGQLQRLAETAATTGQGFQAIFDAINKASGAILQAGGNSEKAQNQFYNNAAVLTELGQGGYFTAEATDQLANSLNQAIHPTEDLKGAIKGLSDESRTFEEVIKRLNADLVQYNKAANDLKNTAAALSEANQKGRRDDPNHGEEWRAQQNAQVEADRVPLAPFQEKEHQQRLEEIDAWAKARQADLTTQAYAASARRNEAERVATLRPGGDLNTPEVNKAKNEEAEAWRKVEDEKKKITAESIRAQIAEEHRGAAERISLMEQIIAIDQAEADAGRESKSKVLEDEIQLNSLKRQVLNQSFQEERDATREAVELAHGHANAVEEIVAAYNKLRAAASATGQTPAVQQQINREQVRDLQRAQTDAFQEYDKSLRAQDQADQIRIKTYNAGLQSQVNMGQMTKTEMAQQEQAYTAAVFEEEEKRLEAAAQNGDLSVQQRQEVNAQLIELYEKDAEAYMQAQQKMTEATKKENEERAKIFEDAFNKIGSTFDSAVVGAITGERGQNIFRSTAKSLVESGVHLVGGLASEFAGKGLASVTGLHPEEGKSGIGDVLGMLVSRTLGLNKDVHGSAGDMAQQKLARAAELQGQVAESGKNAASELHKAAQALLEVAKAQGAHVGAGGRSGTGTGSGSYELGSIPSGGDHGTGASLQDRIAFYRQYAQSKGINPDTVQATVMGEGASAYVGDQGTSFGDFQLHTGGGMGDLAQKAGINVTDPTTWKEQGQFAIDQMAAHRGGGADWYMGQWHSARKFPDLAGKFDQGGGDSGGSKEDDEVAAYRGLQQENTQAQRQTTQALQSTQQAIQQNQQATTDSVQATNDNVQATNKASQSTSDDTTAINQNTDALKTQKPSPSSVAAGAGGTSQPTASGTGIGLNDLNSLIGVAGAITGVFGATNKSPYLAAAGSGIAAISQIGGLFSGDGIFGKLFGGGAGGASGGISGFFSSIFGGGGAAGAATNAVGTTTLTTAGATLTTAGTTLVTSGTELVAAATSLQAAAAAQSSASAASGAGTAVSAGGSGAGFLGSIFGGLFARGGIVPSAAGGMIVGGAGINGGMLSILHPEEMVLPAHISQSVQRMANAANDDFRPSPAVYNGGDTHIHLSSLDSRSGAEWLMANSRHVANAVNRAGRNFIAGTNYHINPR